MRTGLALSALLLAALATPASAKGCLKGAVVGGVAASAGMSIAGTTDIDLVIIHDSEPLEPRGGWPDRMLRESVPVLAGEGVFSGSMPRRWDLFDLGERSGSARLRFRFVSGDSIGGAGWEIARVEVGSEGTGIPSGSLELIAEPNPVRLPSQIAFRINAPLTWTAQPTTLRIYDARGRLVRALGHAPVPALRMNFVPSCTRLSRISAQPRYPDPFIMPPRIPVPRRVISISTDQNAGPAAYKKPQESAKTPAEVMNAGPDPLRAALRPLPARPLCPCPFYRRIC